MWHNVKNYLNELKYDQNSIFIEQLQLINSDEIISETRLNTNKRILNENKIRIFTTIEMAAQTIAFGNCIKESYSPLIKISKPAAMYIASIDKAEFFYPKNELDLNNKILTSTKKTHTLGSFHVVEAKCEIINAEFGKIEKQLISKMTLTLYNSSQ